LFHCFKFSLLLLRVSYFSFIVLSVLSCCCGCCLLFFTITIVSFTPLSGVVQNTLASLAVGLFGVLYSRFTVCFCLFLFCLLFFIVFHCFCFLRIYHRRLSFLAGFYFWFLAHCLSKHFNVITTTTNSNAFNVSLCSHRFPNVFHSLRQIICE
jgi:hypothetical protein